MHGDPLAQGFVDRLAQGIVQVRFPAQDERKAVQGVIAVVHEHFNVEASTGLNQTEVANEYLYTGKL